MLRKHRLTPFNLLILITIIYEFISTAFSGVLRYVLGGSGSSFLIYGSRGAMILCVLLYIFIAIRTGRILKGFLWTLIALLLSAVFGLICIGNISQVGFGLYTMTELLFGAATVLTFRQNADLLKRPILILWSLVVLGVIINIFHQFPWAGYVYELGGYQIQGNRDWTTYGIQRIAGFGRTSIDTAHEIMILSIYLVSFLRSKQGKFLVWIIAGITLYFTTTKTEMGAYIILTIYFVIRQLVPNARLGIFVFSGAFIGVLLPIYSIVAEVNLHLDTLNQKYYLGSLVVRLSETWPSAIHLVQSTGSLLFGRGLGGLGPAQSYFEPNLYNPGDSLYVICYATFGLPFFVLPDLLFAEIKALARKLRCI